jgi:lipopolysaccharide export system protein LptA
MTDSQTKGKRLRAILCLTLVVGVVLWWSVYPRSAEENEKGLAGLDFKLGSDQIHVSAKTLVWDHKTHKATFQYEVVARQKDLAIHCDDLTIYFNEDDTDITRLVSKGNVRIVQMDRRASCQEAVYDRVTNRIILEGDPVIRQGENEVRGERVIFFVAENRSVVEGGEKGRVRVTLIPERREAQDSPE